MKKLSMLDLEDLALGAAILGSGGGGDPAYQLLMAKQQFEDRGPALIMDLCDLDDDALVAPIAYMGAPLVCMEKIPSGNELFALLQMIEKIMDKPVTHLIAAEIGGANAFTPLILSAGTNIPVINADLLGRAFPELQMSSCNLKGISPSPAILADALGNVVVINSKGASDAERFCRNTTVEMGSSAALSIYLMTGKECKESVISGTLERAIEIGQVMRLANAKDLCPIAALLKQTNGRQVGSGVISDIAQVIEAGFLKGTFTISEAESSIIVHYQNEYLMAYREGIAIGSTPDIIIPLEQDTGLPITSESLAYGLRVVLVVIPGPDIWKTKAGLELVGPAYFGYVKNKGEITCQTF